MGDNQRNGGKGEDVTEVELIERFREAYGVWKRLPDPERRFRFPKMGSWPAYLHDPNTAYSPELLNEPRTIPNAAEISRAEQLDLWISAHLKDHSFGTKIMWFTFGADQPLRGIASWMGKSHTLLWKRRKAALAALLAGINGTARKAA